MNHPAKLEPGDDEDYVDYLGRQSAEWSDNPPPAPEGFELVECYHEPRHWPRYTVADDDFYPAWCDAEYVSDLNRKIDQLEHARHHFRGKAVKWVLGWAYQLGIISGYGSIWNWLCNGCVNHISVKGKRPYILGLSRQQWSCLRYGHRFRPLVDCGLCAVCLPCPDCGSTAADHRTGDCNA